MLFAGTALSVVAPLVSPTEGVVVAAAVVFIVGWSPLGLIYLVVH